jgi:hypothetical protein
MVKYTVIPCIVIHACMQCFQMLSIRRFVIAKDPQHNTPEVLKMLCDYDEVGVF